MRLIAQRRVGKRWRVPFFKVWLMVEGLAGWLAGMIQGLSVCVGL